MLPIWKRIKLALHRIPNWKAQYIPRSLNKIADMVSNIKPPQLIILSHSLPINVLPVYLSQRIHEDISRSTSETTFEDALIQSSTVYSAQENYNFGIVSGSSLSLEASSSHSFACNDFNIRIGPLILDKFVLCCMFYIYIGQR